MATDIIIRKQRFKIKTGSEEEALRLRQQLSQEWQYHFLLMMERLSKSLHLPEGKTVYLDKVSIDLGTVAADALITASLQSLETELYKQLSAEIKNEKGNAASEIERSFYQEQPTDSPTTPDNETALFYFFKNGHYPWWFTARQPVGELLEALFLLQPENLLLKLMTIITFRQQGWQKYAQRFVWHIPLPLHQNALAALLSLQRNAIKKAAMEMLISGTAKAESKTLFLLEEKEYNQQLLLYFLQNSDSEGDVVQDFFTHLQQQKKPKGASPFSPDKKQRFTEFGKGETSQSTPDAVEPQGIYIGNAGLILLHLFLPALFDGAGLLNKEKHFVSVEARQYATAWLHQLQGGANTAEEWEMPFTKILCALPVDHVMPADIIISTEDMEEGQEMLKAVVTHWEALRGASADALVATFIQRAGKITWRTDHWLLQAERTGTDILLDRLPWSFGVVKLPWLNTIIYTEW